MADTDEHAVASVQVTACGHICPHMPLNDRAPSASYCYLNLAGASGNSKHWRDQKVHLYCREGCPGYNNPKAPPHVKYVKPDLACASWWLPSMLVNPRASEKNLEKTRAWAKDVGLDWVLLLDPATAEPPPKSYFSCGKYGIPKEKLREWDTWEGEWTSLAPRSQSDYLATGTPAQRAPAPAPAASTPASTASTHSVAPSSAPLLEVPSPPQVSGVTLTSTGLPAYVSSPDRRVEACDFASLPKLPCLEAKDPPRKLLWVCTLEHALNRSVPRLQDREYNQAVKKKVSEDPNWMEASDLEQAPMDSMISELSQSGLEGIACKLSRNCGKAKEVTADYAMIEWLYIPYLLKTRWKDTVTVTFMSWGEFCDILLTEFDPRLHTWKRLLVHDLIVNTGLSRADVGAIDRRTRMPGSDVLHAVNIGRFIQGLLCLESVPIWPHPLDVFYTMSTKVSVQNRNAPFYEKIRSMEEGVLALRSGSALKTTYAIDGRRIYPPTSVRSVSEEEFMAAWQSKEEHKQKHTWSCAFDFEHVLEIDFFKVPWCEEIRFKGEVRCYMVGGECNDLVHAMPRDPFDPTSSFDLEHSPALTPVDNLRLGPYIPGDFSEDNCYRSWHENPELTRMQGCRGVKEVETFAQCALKDLVEYEELKRHAAPSGLRVFCRLDVGVAPLDPRTPQKLSYHLLAVHPECATLDLHTSRHKRVLLFSRVTKVLGNLTEQ